MRHLTDILSYRFGSLNMIPDVTPNGVFYLPPTGWLTSFYNPPSFLLSKTCVEINSLVATVIS
ncbi:hypothetical protein DB324_09085 [Limosilactobacillus reuteri]|nr:hypothetical protein DB323_09010 [Limosilactobacillus reuteri]PUH33399.1 hypothetical protein DB324_09085 [Limosilactobacillus reuteri]